MDALVLELIKKTPPSYQFLYFLAYLAATHDFPAPP